MILLDLNQVFISNLMQSIKKLNKNEINENLIRHMVLNTIRSYNKKYKTKYGEMVICCDGKHYWRKDYFPLYKANRKKDREKSPLDWGLIFDCLSKIRLELEANAPYKVMYLDSTEADDIIATLCKNTKEDILIVSSDGDFAQLQKYPNVQQFSPKLQQYITIEDPELYLKEHIIRGDAGDGVPNILSNDNVFVMGIKQKSIYNTKIEKWLNEEPEEFCTTEQMKRNFYRNKKLVDLSEIPEDIQNQIIDQFKQPKLGSKNKLMEYFMENRMKELMLVLDEF